MSEQNEWQLTELANQDEADIESNELEIFGEDEQGREGSCTVKTTDIAEEAHDRIKDLEDDISRLIDFSGQMGVALRERGLARPT